MPQQKSKSSSVRFSDNSGADHHSAVIEHVSEGDRLEQEDRESIGFNDMLSRVIDKTLRYVFGDINTGVIYKYLERRGCSLSDIPAKPNEFSAELRNTLGSRRGQILGAPTILEDAIVEALSQELGLSPEKGVVFGDRIRRLKKRYNGQRVKTSKSQRT